MDKNIKETSDGLEIRLTLDNGDTFEIFAEKEYNKLRITSLSAGFQIEPVAVSLIYLKIQ